MARFLTKKEIEDIKRDLDEYVKNNSIPMSSLPLHKSNYGFGISPTDVDAKGKFEYQEPEVDEQGTYYGYKILKIYVRKSGQKFLVSPRFAVAWREDGCLTADREPDEHSMHGLHFTKRLDHPELENYISYDEPYFSEKRSVLVKCALSETVVETEQGFRAEHAQIVGVCVDGYWKSYQDYKECSLTDSHKDSFEKIEGGWRYIGRTGAGHTISYWDTGADS